MTENWEQWQGQTVDGEFRLDRYLGGTDHSGVFLTTFGGRAAAIKLLAGEPHREPGAELSHAHLIRIFRTGRWQRDDAPLHYVVMEFADEVLSEIIPQRALSPEEASEALAPVLDALSYIHQQGLTHGHVKPSNIMSVAEQLKLSSDGLRHTGEMSGLHGVRSPYDAPELIDRRISPAADVWALGVTLVEVLTQRLPVSDGAGALVLPESLPEKFREIANHCLDPDLDRRWTVRQVAALLGGSPPAPELLAAPPPDRAAAQAAVPRRRLIGGATALVLALAAVLAGSRLLRKVSTPEPHAAPSGAVPRENKPAAAPAPTPEEKPSPAGRVRGRVERQVSPDVSASARQTIRGTVRVRVSARVDASGKVVETRLETPRVSRYFANAALQAARRWKFEPATVEGRPVPTSWILEFDFARSGIQMHSRPAS